MIGWVTLLDGILDVQKLPLVLVDNSGHVGRLDIAMVGRKSAVSTEIIKYQTLRNLDLLERIDAIKAPSQKEQVLYGRVE